MLCAELQNGEISREFKRGVWRWAAQVPVILRSSSPAMHSLNDFQHIEPAGMTFNKDIEREREMEADKVAIFNGTKDKNKLFFVPTEVRTRNDLLLQLQMAQRHARIDDLLLPKGVLRDEE
ncbi:hypothetical protein MRB53_030498 [Persea americana]|uniref:Uncharacterized protein n=1 Tax=Persea americana TaxID=3435 RepID=A0ACC2KLE9_PERAE|nr:hypothetical protein MRB53_030498 [Persea americana]